MFAVAIWGAYLIRTFNQSALGLVTFWTTRVGALFSLYIVLELLLSGRLVPLTLMPDWVQTLAWLLPFRWTFYFPIETLVGDLSNARAPRRPRDAALLDRSSASASSRSSGGTRSAATPRWGTDMTTLRVALLHLRIGVMNDLQYRVNFALQILQSLLALATGLVVLRARLLAHDRAERLDRSRSCSRVLGVQIVMGGVIHAVIQPNMMRLTEEVREGKLDHALTKPVDAQMLVSVREVQLWQAVDVITGGDRDRASLSSRLGGDLGALDALAFGVALVFGAVLLYCFWLVLATGSFWVVHMWHPARALRGHLPDGTLAGRHLPGLAALRRHVPRADRVRGDGAGGGRHLAARLADARLRGASSRSRLFAFTRWFWRFGLRRYSGASA